MGREGLPYINSSVFSAIDEAVLASVACVVVEHD